MIVTVWNGKGGVGKTTTAVAVAVALARRSEPVYLIDLDPQANASKWLDTGTKRVWSILDVLAGGVSIGDAAMPALGVEHLSLIAGEARLTRVASVLEDDPKPQYALRSAIATLRTGAHVVLDCSPAYDALAAMALIAGTHHIVPMRTAAMDLLAAQETLKRAEAIRASANPTLKLAGFVLSAYDARTKVARLIDASLAQEYPNVPTIRVPSAVAVSMAPGAHAALDEYRGCQRAVIAYRELLDALVETVAK